MTPARLVPIPRVVAHRRRGQTAVARRPEREAVLQSQVAVLCRLAEETHEETPAEHEEKECSKAAPKEEVRNDVYASVKNYKKRANLVDCVRVEFVGIVYVVLYRSHANTTKAQICV